MEAAAQSSDGATLTRLLLARRVRPDASDVIGGGPLFWAVAQGETETARLLLQAGADPKKDPPQTATYPGSLLTRAVRDLDVPTLRLLLQYEPAKPEDLIAALRMFSDTREDPARADRDMVGLILPKVMDVNTSNSGGLTALMEASAVGHVAAVRALLDKGADVNARGQTGGTALMMAVAGTGAGRQGKYAPQQEEITALLLAHGAAVNARNGGGGTPLLYAIEGGIHDQPNSLSRLVTLLLAHGADPNLADVRGESPLSAARAAYPASNSDAITRLLRQAGADFTKTKPAPLPSGSGGYFKAF